MIPKMNYYIQITQDDEKVLEECRKGIEKQSNVSNIHTIRKGWSILLGGGDCDWFVMVDDDVQLCDEWIEQIWKYKDLGVIIAGRAYSHPAIRKYKRGLKKRRLMNWSELLVQSALINKTGLIWIEKGWYEVPVISEHCPSYKHNPYYQGMKDPKLASKEKALRTFLGGIKLAIKERHWIFAKNGLFRAVGMLMVSGRK